MTDGEKLLIIGALRVVVKIATEDSLSKNPDLTFSEWCDFAHQVTMDFINNQKWNDVDHEDIITELERMYPKFEFYKW